MLTPAPLRLNEWPTSPELVVDIAGIRNFFGEGMVLAAG